ncbi:membrane protein insertase YidC [Portibacter marinus]|uniref:membrane protein insertase YidC n=1 Tax=Portibacter marinus TaxID=2898660 RepID=UPI001F210846|nr:membrane protein insertase YidC [Portibacter marinus]
MDKRQLLGLLLIFGLFYAWSVMNNRSRVEIEEQQRIKDSIAMANAPVIESEPAKIEDNSVETAPIVQKENDSLQNAKLAYQYGPFAQAIGGEEEIYTLENDLIKVNFSNKGGFVKDVLLKEHYKLVLQEDNTDKQIPLYLLKDNKNKFRYELPISGVPGEIIRTDELSYAGTKNGNTITFRAPAGEGAYFEQKYTIEPGKYDLDYSISLVGMDRMIASGNNEINLNWVNYLDKLEQNDQFEKFYSTIYFKEVDEDSDYCNCRKDDEEDLEGEPLRWVANVNQFFNTSLIAKTEPFSGGVFETEMLEEEEEDLKLLTSNVEIAYDGSAAFNFDMSLYLGPNDFETLRSYEVGLEEVIPFGRSIFGSINRWVIRPFFNFLDNIIGNKGIAIIIMIFLIKMILYPLNYKMLKSQAKMGALKPEINKIKDKHKDDPQAAQMENMKLYREYGVSPLGGCMPMIIQIPIWYALFRFFPASIDFRQESFLWANDLSSYDVIAYLPFHIPAYGAHISLFTLLWAVSTVAYTYYNTKHMDMSANPAMKYVQYFMPLMFLFFFNNYASGLTCYMFFSNLFNVGQTVITKNFVFDDDKIRAEVMQNKDKPKKVGKFQQRMQEAMKQSQAIQEQRKKSKKK